jgi:hypothetical protein
MKTKIKNNKNRILYIRQNIFESIENRLISDNKSFTLIVPHVCNNINVFGAGFAYHVSQHYPTVKENFHLLGKKASLGYTQFLQVKSNKKTNGKIIFANMIAQHGTISKINPRPINYASLIKCMMDIKIFIESLEYKDDTTTEIHAPKFGSRLAGGNWSFIENLIEDVWPNIDTYIYVAK